LIASPISIEEFSMVAVTLKRMFSGLATIYDKILTGSGIVAGISLWGLMLVVFLEVLLRYVFHVGRDFTLSYACFLTAFICFFGAAYNQRIRGHVSVDLLTSRLSKRVRRWVDTIALIISLFAVIVFLYWSVILVKGSIQYGSRTYSTLATPLAFPQSSMVIGFLLLSIVLLVQIVTAIRRLFRNQNDSGLEGGGEVTK